MRRDPEETLRSPRPVGEPARPRPGRGPTTIITTMIDHGHDHEHDDDSTDVALVPVVLVVGAVGGVLLVLRAWRRRRAA